MMSYATYVEMREIRERWAHTEAAGDIDRLIALVQEGERRCRELDSRLITTLARLEDLYLAEV